MFTIHKVKHIFTVILFVLGGAVLSTSSSIPISDAQSNTPIVESDDPRVQQEGTWNLQLSPNASGGSYLLSSGSTEDVLILEFYGSSVEIMYAESPIFGSFAIEIDNYIHRTVLASNNQSTFNRQAAVQYLDSGHHILRIFPVDGIIAIDAFAATPAPLAQQGAALAPIETFDDLPTNIILIIGDGMGLEHILASGYFWYGEPGYFPFESFSYIAEMTTGMAGASWTDSAASATAMATGVKVNEGVLSIAIPGNGADLETIMEYMQPLGISTGLITTAQVASATPAAFVAHNSNRNNSQQITADILTTKPNLYFSGANDWMTPQTASAAGYTVLEDRDSMLAFDTESATFVSGQFGAWAMPYEYDGYPSTLPHLFEMTTTALNILDNNPNGFLLVIENEHTDSAGHINDIQRSVYETKAVAEAVQSALDWADGRTDTLIIVTADHETGGLNVIQNNGQGNLPTVTWTNTNHSSRHVPIFAWGAGADRIEGVLDNTDIYRILHGWEPTEHAGVTVTPNDLNIPLLETDATYSVVLRTQPTSNVSISIQTSGGVSVDTHSITFNTSNWNIPKTVTVSATGNGQITHTTTSSDKTYHEIYLIDDVNVTLGNYPNAPTNLQSTVTSPSTIDLTWNDNSSDENTFHIERSSNGVDWIEIATVSADSTSFQDTVLCDTTYHYRVRAFRDVDGQFSTYSNIDQATTDLCPLSPPSDLSASPNGNSQIDLMWMDNSADENAFHIERSPNGVDWSEIATVSADSTSFQDTVGCGTSFHYRVRAFRDVDGQFSTYSNIDQATTDLCPLSPPSDLSASPNGNSQIDLMWTDNSADENAFHIERSPNGVDWSEIATVSADSTSFQDTVLCDTTYHYRVRAFRDVDGQFSIYSNSSEVATANCINNNPILIAPLNIDISSLDALPPTFEWNEAIGITWYRLYLNSTSGVIHDNWYHIEDSVMSCNSYRCTVAPDFVLNNGDYTWYIHGWGPNGFTDWTAPGNFTINIPAPNAVNKSTPADTAILANSNVALIWDHDPNATWYQLWISGSATWYDATAICDTTCTVSQSLNNAGYQWYVRAYGQGGYGDWGTGYTFTVAVPAPSIINKTAPIGTLLSATPTFEWQHDTSAAWYQIWIGTGSETAYSQWHKAAAICDTTDCWLDTGLTFIGNYSWFVRGWSVGGYGDWGTGADFGYTFSLIAPSGIVSGVNVTYQWDNLGTPTTWYRLWVGMSSGTTVFDQWVEATSVCNGTSCSVPTSSTLPAGNYIWYLLPYGDYGNGAWKAGPPFTVSP